MDSATYPIDEAKYPGKTLVGAKQLNQAPFPGRCKGCYRTDKPLQENGQCRMCNFFGPPTACRVTP